MDRYTNFRYKRNQQKISPKTLDVDNRLDRCFAFNTIRHRHKVDLAVAKFCKTGATNAIDEPEVGFDRYEVLEITCWLAICFVSPDSAN